MRKEIVVYLCDNCEKVLSKGEKGRIHLSIDFGAYSGWVSAKNNWKHLKVVKGIHQFCNGECLGEYFEKKGLDIHKLK